MVTGNGDFDGVSNLAGGLSNSRGIFSLALWETEGGTLLYEHDPMDFLKAYPVASNAITQTPLLTGTWSGDSLYHGIAVSSNGSSDGIVGETTGDHSQAGIPGTLRAWNASDLTQELCNSNGKFVAPLVVGGDSNLLVTYGLQSPRQAVKPSPNLEQTWAVLRGPDNLCGTYRDAQQNGEHRILQDEAEHADVQDH